MVVIFDIDGTLTQSNDLDTELWVKAAEEVFGFREIDTDWSRYRHVTDGGILAELFLERLGRTVEEVEVCRMVGRLRDLAEGCTVEEIPGARRFVAELQAQGHILALATGCWRDIALPRLACAGFEIRWDGAAFADDAVSREEIMVTAYHRAVAKCGVMPPAAGASGRAVYFGDGVWDAVAARAVGFPFLGITRDGAVSERLRELGALAVFPDYRDGDAIFSALGAGSLPGGRCT